MGNDLGTPRMYPSEVVVRVWPDTYRYGNQNTFFKRSDKGIGYAAVTFRHTTHTGGIAGVYVSWWPEQSLTVGLKALKTQQGESGGSYFLDKFLCPPLFISAALATKNPAR